MVLDLVFIVFVLSICFTCKRNGASSETYLSIDNTKKLRGILAIAIVLHHISEKTIASGKLFPLMVHAGYLVVAVFFFSSVAFVVLVAFFLVLGAEFLTTVALNLPLATLVPVTCP